MKGNSSIVEGLCKEEETSGCHFCRYSSNNRLYQSVWER